MQPSDPRISSPVGDPLVLLHGLFGKPENWDSVRGRLGGTWRALAPQLPLLDLPRERDPVESLGAHVLGVMDGEGIERAVLVGNSLGGHVAIRLALAHPRRVRALVLTGSSGLFERGFDSCVPRRPTEAFMRAKMAEVFHDPVHVTDALVDEVSAIVADVRNVARIIWLARWAKHDNVAPQLPRIVCPVLLVWGADDRITPPAVARAFHAALPGSELQFLDACGHAPMIERPAEFGIRVERFLRRLAALGPAPALAR